MDGGAGAGTVGGADDTAQLILVQPGFVGRGGAFVPHQRFVYAGGVHVAAQQCAAAVVFSHEIDTVIGQAGDGARQGGLPQTPCSIVRQAVARAGFIGTDQLVVEVVGVGPYAIPGQVAFGVMSEGGASGGRVLVEAVGGVAFGAVGIARPLVTVVGPALPCDFLHLVARVGGGLVLCGAGEVVCEGGQCTLGAVGIAGGGAVTQGHRGTPAEVIIGVGRQVDRAGFLDRGWTVQCVIGAGDVERGFRPGKAGAVACRVVLVGECLATGSGTSDNLAICAPNMLCYSDLRELILISSKPDAI